MKFTTDKVKMNINKNIHHLINKNEYEVITKSAIEFLLPNRLDILAKYIYVKFHVLKLNSDFGKRIYLNHIKLINEFFENDGSKKIGADAFLDSFNNLINLTKKDNFIENTILPISESNTISSSVWPTISGSSPS